MTHAVAILTESASSYGAGPLVKDAQMRPCRTQGNLSSLAKVLQNCCGRSLNVAPSKLPTEDSHFLIEEFNITHQPHTTRCKIL